MCANRGENGFFAVIASIGRVGCHARISQDIEWNDLKFNAAIATEFRGVIEFKCGLERGMNAVGFGPGSKTSGAFEQKSGVTSAGKPDGTGRMMREKSQEFIERQIHRYNSIKYRAVL